jgi:hypothetical protein
VILQPCRPPPSFDHVAEQAVLAHGQGSLGRLAQLLLVPLALGGGQVGAGLVDSIADVQLLPSRVRRHGSPLISAASVSSVSSCTLTIDWLARDPAGRQLTEHLEEG